MGEKLQCRVCDYQAADKGNLTKHQQSIHEGKKYHCRVCDYQATQKSHDFTTHQKSIHEGKKYHCSLCDYRQLRRAISPDTITQCTWFRNTNAANAIHSSERPSNYTSAISSYGEKNIPITCAVIMQLKKAILRDTRIECTRIMKY